MIPTHDLRKLIKLKILITRIEIICEITGELDYLTYYTKKIIKIYINSNYDKGIYKIIMNIPLSNVYDVEYIIKFINYYIKSKYNNDILNIILNDKIGVGNKIIKLNKKMDDII